MGHVANVQEAMGLIPSQLIEIQESCVYASIMSEQVSPDAMSSHPIRVVRGQGIPAMGAEFPPFQFLKHGSG